jgi:RNA polymerase sigma factor (sigma-70 family)
MREDRVLIQACLEGDQLAWNELVERYQRLVYSIPRRLGLPEADADDIFQTVFGIALRRLETLRAEDRLSAWLIRVTYRESWRWARRKNVSRALSDEQPDDASPAEADVLRWERQQLLYTALAQVETRCRELLTALFLERDTPSYEEIARRFGMKVGSIGPTRARCFQRLEEILTSLGLE